VQHRGTIAKWILAAVIRSDDESVERDRDVIDTCVMVASSLGAAGSPTAAREPLQVTTVQTARAPRSHRRAASREHSNESARLAAADQRVVALIQQRVGELDATESLGAAIAFSQ
jgi:hypothetical protein